MEGFTKQPVRKKTIRPVKKIFFAFMCQLVVGLPTQKKYKNEPGKSFFVKRHPGFDKQPFVRNNSDDH